METFPAHNGNGALQSHNGDGGNRTRATFPADINLTARVPWSAFHPRRLPVRAMRWLEDRPRDACTKRRPPSRKGHVPGNKGKKYPGTAITPADTQALMAACAETVHGQRMRALVATLAGTGLRISEALALTPADVNFEDRFVTVQKGKGGKRGNSGIRPFALTELQVWLPVRADRGFTDSQPVFCVLQGPTAGGRIRPVQIRTSLHALAARAGVNKRVHPHGFRHGLAVEMVRKGVPLPIISRQLRHGNVAITTTYLHGIADFEVFDAVTGMDD